MMQRGVKIRLKPTAEQLVLFKKSAGVARWSYNGFLSENDRLYEEYQKTGSGPKSISEGSYRKYVNQKLKPTTHTWLKEVGSNVMKQGVKDAANARKRFFEGKAERPKFKAKHKAKPSFYVNYETLKKTAEGFRGEKLGIVKTTKPLPKIAKGATYSNPRITFDGKFWYLSVAIAVKPQKVELTDRVLGIDVGIHETAVTSEEVFYHNINKEPETRRIETKLHRAQRSLSRMTEANIAGYGKNRKPIWKRPLRLCKNFQKKQIEIRALYKKLTDLRQNYLHQISNEIVKTKPSRIIMENLNIKGMMKNKYLAKSFADQKLFELTRQIKYKCENYGIEFMQASRWFPSSKLCSCCGHKKFDLKLNDRVYHCNHCGLVIDRDYNASINLATYTGQW